MSRANDSSEVGPALLEVTAEALVGELFEQVQTLYRRAYRYAVDSERVKRLRGLMADFGAEPGFRAIVARSVEDRLDGMAFGYTQRPGQRWYGFVAPLLDDADRDHWLHGTFGLAQLSVDPQCRGRRLGGRLHDRVLAGLSQPRAVLAVALDNTIAQALYRGCGWRTVLPRFSYPLDHVPEPYAVMGLDLPTATDPPG